MRHDRRSPTMARQRGFSLVEMLVTLLLFAIVLIAFLSTLDASARLAKNQENIADMTESLRYGVAALVKMIRQTGTGGLPIVYQNQDGDLDYLALQVQNNLSARSFGSDLRPMVNGTDVLTLRGVMTGEIYDINRFPSGAVRVFQSSPFTGQAQPMNAGAAQEGDLILISLMRSLRITPDPTVVSGVGRSYGEYRIAEVAGELTTGTDAALGAYTDIPWREPPAPTETTPNLNWGGAFSNTGGDLAYSLGFLDDFVYFVALNPGGEPSLYRVRNNGPAQEMIPGIVDMQVALGCDTSNDGVIQPIEWLQSDTNTAVASGDHLVALREVRLSLVARTDDPDLRWTERLTAMPEDGPNTPDSKYRHRVITVRIALRSHPELEAL